MQPAAHSLTCRAPRLFPRPPSLAPAAPQDLRAARASCALLDAASRQETPGRGETLRLALANAGGPRGAPDFSRFPLLRRLLLVAWELDDATHFACLHALFDVLPGPRRAAAVAALAAVVEVDMRKSWHFGAAALASVLKQLIGVRTLWLPYAAVAPSGPTDALVSVSVVAALLPRLQSLHANIRGICDDEPCGRVIAGLSQLRLLSLLDVPDGDGALAVLPCSRLTSLSFDLDYAAWPCGAHDLGLPWPALRELRGIQLSPEWVEPLAAGLPQLTLLVAQAAGAWPAAAPAAFPRVARAWLRACPRGFRGVWLCTLLPAAEHLALDFNYHLRRGGFAVLSGLTRLTHLEYGDNDGESSFTGLSPCDWDDLASLPALRELAVDAFAGAGVVAALSRLTSLEVLRLNLAAGLLPPGAAPPPLVPATAAAAAAAGEGVPQGGGDPPGDDADPPGDDPPAGAGLPGDADPPGDGAGAGGAADLPGADPPGDDGAAGGGDGDGDVLPWGASFVDWDGSTLGRFSLAPVADVANRLPRLRALYLFAPGADAAPGALAAFASSLERVERLRVLEPRLSAPQASALARGAAPPLRRLAVALRPDGAGEAPRLAAAAAAAGLELVLDAEEDGGDEFDIAWAYINM